MLVQMSMLAAAALHQPSSDVPAILGLTLPIHGGPRRLVGTMPAKRVAETVINCILKGPVLKTFEKWTDAVDVAFPGRHVVDHGRYDPGFINEENSIKVFLLMDTLWSLMRNG
jgi:hypothetical protein